MYVDRHLTNFSRVVTTPYPTQRSFFFSASSARWSHYVGHLTACVAFAVTADHEECSRNADGFQFSYVARFLFHRAKLLISFGSDNL